MAKVTPLPPQFQFDPKKKLAEGSYGAVFTCNDPRYAVKQILLSKLENAEVAVMAFVQRGSLHTRCVGLVLLLRLGARVPCHGEGGRLPN